MEACLCHTIEEGAASSALKRKAFYPPFVLQHAKYRYRHFAKKLQYHSCLEDFDENTETSKEGTA